MGPTKGHQMHDMKGMQMPSSQSGADQQQTMPGMKMPAGKTDGSGHESMAGMTMPPEQKQHDMPRMKMPSGDTSQGSMASMMHGPDHHGPGNAMVAMMPKSRLSEPGTGLEDAERRGLLHTRLPRRPPCQAKRWGPPGRTLPRTPEQPPPPSGIRRPQ